MADQFSQVTTKGYGNRIVDSIKGIAFGILLFLASFAVLYWNEGRVNLANVAVNAVEAPVASVDSTLEDKQVYVTGAATAGGVLGDGLYLKDGEYVAVNRNVEMYAWVEQQSSSSDTNMGGSETTTTTYSYSMDWTSAPSSTGDFQVPEGHSNPAKTLDGQSYYATGVKVGAYDVDVAKVDLPEMSKVTLSADNTSLSSGYLAGGFVYLPSNAANSFEAPGIGDMRVSYTALNKGVNVTVFGKQEGSAINAFIDFDNDNAKVYRMFTGGRDEAIATLGSEYTMMAWILRGVGFLMMWIGLSMLFGPLSVLLDVVPFFGKLSRGIVGLATFLVALVLSGVTILISMILHNVIAIVVSVVVVIGIAAYILKKKGSAGPTVVKA